MSIEGTTTDGRADAATRDALATEITGLQRDLNAMAWRVVGPADLPDLTPQQFRVLQLVACEPGVLASGVGHFLGVSAPTASGLVERLVEKGLIARGEDPTDRRVRRLTLTEAGQALIADLESAADRMFRSLLPYLDTDLLHRIRATYTDILTAMRAAERTRAKPA